MSYDAFISYRRESGAAEARLIRTALAERGKRCFLDVADLSRGYFDEALLEHVAQIPNFVLILSPGALDRCANPQDWLLLEIQQALLTGSTIIPVMLGGFQFPRSLPEEIRELPRHQAIDYSHRYFDAMMAEIARSLDKPRTLKRQFQPPPPPAPVAPAWVPAPAAAIPPIAHPAFSWLFATLVFAAVLAGELLDLEVRILFTRGQVDRPPLGFFFLYPVLIAFGFAIVVRMVRNGILRALLFGLCGAASTLVTLLVLIPDPFTYWTLARSIAPFLWAFLVPGSTVWAKHAGSTRLPLLLLPIVGASLARAVNFVLLISPELRTLGIAILISNWIGGLLVGIAFYLALPDDPPPQ